MLTAEDALEAKRRGVDGIIVSNHGGRQVDGAVASLDALVEVRDALGDDATVLVDSGIRAGADVVKAMALGADAVLLGRPYVWGLAVGGQEGVEVVIRQLLAETDLTLALAGGTAVRDLDRSALADRRVGPWTSATRPRKPPFAPRCAAGSRRTSRPSSPGRGRARRSTPTPGYDWSRKLADAGYAGLTWPKEYGGSGAPYPHQAIFLEETARAEAPQHMNVIGLGMAGPTIIAHGTEEQKARYLPKILSAEEIWCQGFSEPDAGSDLASARTSARLEGDHFVVDGQKVWSSFAHVADWCILVTRSDPESVKHAGMTYMLVDMHAPGVEVRPLRQITGEAEFNEIFFTGVAGAGRERPRRDRPGLGRSR